MTQMGSTNKIENNSSNMSIGDHLEELRIRVIFALLGVAACTIVGLVFGGRIISFMELPYTSVMAENSQLQTLSPTEGLTSYFKIALITGLILSSPWVFYHLWMFIAAGLYAHERRYINIAAPFSAVLFICGAVFFLLVVAPLTLKFLLKVNDHLGLSSHWTFPYYISFVTNLMLIFGLAFQTPIVIFFLNRTGIVSLAALCKSRKYVLLIITILAAMATPPDVISQIALAIPLYLLFELGILLSYLATRKKVTVRGK